VFGDGEKLIEFPEDIVAERIWLFGLLLLVGSRVDGRREHGIFVVRLRRIRRRNVRHLIQRIIVI
jgi:hypothetical protein